MEYITLPNLTNPYPQPGNYIKTGNDDVTLFGLYPDINTYLFTLEDLSEVTPVDDTDFRFIMSVSNDENDILDPILYTSRAYYDDLIAAFEEGNPYFINYSFNDVFIVQVYLNQFMEKFTPLAEKESKYGIHVKRNIFITDDKDIIYEELVKYINWLVSSSELDDVYDDGVIPYYDISLYTRGRLNTDTLMWGDESRVIFDMRMKDLLDELKSVENDIRDISDFLLNPTKTDFTKLSYAVSSALGSAGIAAMASATAALGVSSFITTVTSLGLIAIAPYAAIGIAAVAVVAGAVAFIRGLFGSSSANMKRQAEDDLIKYTNYLKNELARLYRRRDELLREIKSLELGTTDD